MHIKLKNTLIWIITTIILVIVDQYTKAIAVNTLKDTPGIPLWEGVFELVYVENRGAAFGMLQGQQTFFYITTSIVLLFIFYVILKMPDMKEKKYRFLMICAIFITAGAIGNLIDRVILGYVVDFLYFKLINFPVFNVADIYVSVSSICLLILLLFYYKDEDLRIFEWKKNKEEEV